MTIVTEPDPSLPRRTVAQLVLGVVVPLVIIAVLVTDAATGGVVWAPVLGAVGCLAWLLRVLLRPRIATPGGGWGLVLLLLMLVPGSLAGVPGDATAFAPALASIVLVVGNALVPLAWQFVWCGASAALVVVGAFVGPDGRWTATTVAAMFVLALLIALVRRQGASHRAAELAAMRERHEAELAEARGSALDPEAVRERFPQLSVREAEVLGLMARGRSNAEIAQDLYLSVATVKSHVNALFAKLPARDRAHAIAIAYGTALPG